MAANQPLPEESLVPADDRLETLSNNLYFDLATDTKIPIISEIIRAHPLRQAITENPNTSPTHVPEIYLQQLWYTFTEGVTRLGHKCLRGRIENLRTTLSAVRLRNLLDLPAADHYPDKADFDENPGVDAVLDLIRGLGYQGELNQINQFRRTNLAPLWQTLATIISRTLTGIHRGTDGGSYYSLLLLAGVAYHRHLDYATIIFEEIVRMVKEKDTTRQKTFIPFQRFLTIFIAADLETYHTIPRRLNNPQVQVQRITRFLRIRDLPNIVAMPVPVALLRILNQESEAVREYMRVNRIAPLAQPEPVVPAPGAVAQGEGPSGLRARVRRGAPSRVVIEREESVERGGGSGEGGEIHESEGVVISDSEASTQAEPESKSSTERTQTESSSSGQSISFGPRPSPVRAESTGTRQVSDHPADDHHDLSDISATFGDVPEMEREDAELDVVVSDSESEREKKEGEGTPDQESRETTSTTGRDSVPADIETDTGIPPVHAPHPTSHSASTQLEVVSLHGESSHTQSATHSEFAGFEISGQPLPSTSSFRAQSSLAPILTGFHSFARTRSPLARLRDAAGTPVAASTTEVTQGSSGSPSSATILPTLREGHGSERPVPTEPLSEVGVTPELRSFMDSKFSSLDSGLREYVNTQLHSEINSLRAQIRALENRPPTVIERDYSIDELKDLLHAKLNSVANPTTEQSTILAALQQQPQPSSSSSTTFQDTVLQALNALTSTVSSISKRLEVVEESCKAQSESRKRRHDDPEDPGHHEGEKRQRRYIGAQSTTLRIEAAPVSRPSEGQSGSVSGGKQQQAEPAMTDFEFEAGQGAESETERQETPTILPTIQTPSIQIPQIQTHPKEPESSLPESSTEKSKGKRPITEEVEETPLINIRKVFTTVNRELLDIFPPEQGQFNIAPIDLISQQQSQGSEQKEGEWPVPETYHGGPKPLATHERIIAERPNIRNIRPREALATDQPRWPTQWLNTPYLEERIPGIFSEVVREVDDLYVLNSQEHEKSVRFAATLHTSEKQQVASKYPIVKIEFVYLRNFLNYSMVHFHVTRADGKRYTFHEVELRFLNLGDITHMEDELACKIEKNREEQRALQVLRDFMRKKILLCRTHDLQLGAEADLAKINLKKPNQ